MLGGTCGAGAAADHLGVFIAMCLFSKVLLPPGAQHSDDRGAQELVLEDDECPLQIFREWPADKGGCLGFL